MLLEPPGKTPIFLHLGVVKQKPLVGQTKSSPWRDWAAPFHEPTWHFPSFACWYGAGKLWRMREFRFTSELLLMEEILHQLISSLSHYLYTRFHTSLVVQDFSHQQYDTHEIQSKVLLKMFSCAISYCQYLNSYAESMFLKHLSNWKISLF